MKAGDIVFVGGNGPIDKAIRVFDKGPYNHVCIFVNDTQVLEAQYNTKVHIIDYPYDSPNFATGVVSLNLNSEQTAKLQKLADQYLGERYDYGDIFLIFLRLEFGIHLQKFHNDKEEICSELIAHLLIGLGLADNSSLFLAPNELYRYLKNKGY